MPGTRESIDTRLRRLEDLAEDIGERQKLSRLDTVIFLLFPVLLLTVTTLSSIIMNYSSIAKIPTIGPWIVNSLPSLLIIPFGALLVTFLLFLKAYLGGNLTGRISACSLIYAYTALFLIFLVQTQIPALIPDLAKESREWFIAPLLNFFSFLFPLGAVYFAISFQAVVSGWIAKWLQKNVPRKWRAAGLSAKRVPAYRTAYSKLGKATWAFACGLYVVMIGFAVARGGLKSVSAVQLGLLATLLLIVFAMVQRKRIQQLSRASTIIRNYRQKHQRLFERFI